ncbi:2Fe-2S iron-sulfur cluster-binding protein [Alkalibacillus aidingensis]|uniref:2Fe-2S iron-sulfur cluster-binding protein n=1 Tax=Alkalibacillus aidingensis TaxID=2747607 RepID=UPI0016612264|nr:2Fe-2S iron-sulfur cluster-binding protein [Alkalibacillus aidingensis]
MKLHVQIQRSSGKTDHFEVSYGPEMTVLNILEEIYRHHDATIAYRYSCRTGLCTTCLMMINGKPELSCQKIVETDDEGILTLAPLPKGETIKDLVKEM